MPTQLSESGAIIPQSTKEASRDKAFHLFTITTALSAGKLPTNAQLQTLLSNCSHPQSLESRKADLSEDGKQLYDKENEMIEFLKRVLADKNDGELVQNFLYHCQSAGKSISTEGIKQTVSESAKNVNVDEAKHDAKQGLHRLLVLTRVLLTDAEFRNILTDLVNILREMLTDAAFKLGDQANKIGDKVTDKITSAADNLNRTIQERGDQIQAKIDSAGEGIETDVDRLQRRGEKAVEGRVNEISAADAKASMMERLQKAFSLSEDRSDKFRDISHRHYDRSKNYLSSKLPQEKRDDLIRRLKVVVSRIQDRAEYQEAVDYMLDTVGKWRARAVEHGGTAAQSGIETVDDDNLHQAMREFKEIIQRWASGKSLDPLENRIQQMWEKANTDPLLKEYFDMIGIYVRKLLTEPGYIISDDSTVTGQDLVDYGRELLEGQYKPDTDYLINESTEVLRAMNNDPMAVELRERVKDLGRLIFYDENDKLSYKPHLLKDFKVVYLPAFLESFQFIPLPKIEYSDPDLDLTLDNVILTSSDLVPRLVELKTHHVFRIVVYGKDDDRNEHDFKFTAKELELNLKDVMFTVHKKTGFYKINDHGIATILLSKKNSLRENARGDTNGVNIKIEGYKNNVDRNSTISISKVKVDVNHLEISIRESKHNFLYKIGLPFVKGAIKAAITKVLEQQIRDFLVSADSHFTNMNKAMKTEKETTGKGRVSQMTDMVKKKKSQERRESRRDSKLIFDEHGMTFEDTEKHRILKVGIVDDVQAVDRQREGIPWASTAFDVTSRRDTVTAL